eukprot:gene6418-6649_t
MGRYDAVLQKPERFCVGCRGCHQAAHERNPAWQPYTPLHRFRNLNMLDSRFLTAVRSQELPVALTGGLPAIRWLGVSEQGKSLKPHTMSEQQYKHLLPLFFQGAREGHESYRFLSTAAAVDLLAAASSSAGVVAGGRLQHGGKAKAAVPPPQASWLLEVLPEVAVAVKAGLNTLQPSLAAHMLLMLQRVTLVDLVDETLQLMVEGGGMAGLAAVKRCMPTFDYCNPKD